MRAAAKSSDGPVPRLVLVHGAAHGAWCWELLAPKLRERGIKVDVLDLPGLGDDPTPPKDVTFHSYVDAIIRIIESKPGRVLLLGHSMGGWPVSAVGEAIPHRIAKLQSSAPRIAPFP